MPKVSALTAAPALRGADGLPMIRTLTVTNKALASNVATLTTAAAHGLVVGQPVAVSGVDATFNSADPSTDVVASVPTSTTYTYNRTAADVGSAASGGTVLTQMRAAVSQVQDFVRPLFARKTSVQTVNNSTTLVNDTQLLLALAANGVYTVEGNLIYDTAAGKFKLGWTVPAGATLSGFILAYATGGSGSSAAGNLYGGLTESSATGVGGAGLGTKLVAVFRALIIMGATAGNFQVQWAQNVLSTTDTNVFADSWVSGSQRA
ncbi:MAG: hypothetical protein ABIW84_10780 [Ilumatobacteraceae bacterium]